MAVESRMAVEGRRAVEGRMAVEGKGRMAKGRPPRSSLQRHRGPTGAVEATEAVVEAKRAVAADAIASG